MKNRNITNPNMEIKNHIKHFNELTLHEFYDIAALRCKVFIMEQNCLYKDLDGVDKVSHHIYFQNANNEMIATARIIPPNVSYPNMASIGRVLVDIDYRKHNIGREMMEKTIAFTKNQYPNIPIKIGAQQYLEKFYSSLGFVSNGNYYLEDDIPHLHMILK